MNADDLFASALDIDDPAERHTYLERACAGDEPLRRELDSLLAAHERVGEFLRKRPTLVAGLTELAPCVDTVSEKAGDRIGRYHLLEPIGEGGFGVVWMAEQEEPVRRRVALKIIKLGMDTRSVVVRFEAERQALALMDHPNIAQVFDGGATDAGRPFFVMELVKGVPITNYCEERKLSTRARLELVVQVCRAVQHAHQKGVIHRDLKPSNILVTEQDGRPLPKVIDFGIAKATGVRLTDKTLFTGFQQWLGTPSYMSPEQAGLGSLDVDTRSDTYSLGVVLYELLTGRTPFDTQALLKEGYEAVLRTIREVDPPRPSTRLTELVEADVRNLTAKPDSQEPNAETNRAIQRLLQKKKELLRTIRGDLDWIVMKCLEKDRNRRYETANSLALDLERHLRDEPILARPPSAAYRWQKFARKHRLAVAVAAGFVFLLTAATGVSTALALWANRERGKAEKASQAEAAQLLVAEKERARAVGAEQEQSKLRQQAEANAQKATTEAAKSRQVAQFLTSMLEGVGPNVALGRDATLLREILDKTVTRLDEELKEQPEVEADLREVLGSVYHDLADFQKAELMQRRVLLLRRQTWGQNHPLVGRALNALAGTVTRLERPAEAESLYREALTLARRREDSTNEATLLTHLGTVVRAQGRLAEAEALQREALSQRRKIPGQDGAVAHSLHNLADVLREQGKLDEAEDSFREAVELMKKVKGPAHLDLALALDNFGHVLRLQNKLAEAESMHRQALAMHEKLHGREHRSVATSLSNLAKVCQRQGKLAEAETLQREALALRKKLLPNLHPAVAQALNDLAAILEAQGKLTEAETFQRESLDLAKKIYGDRELSVATQMNNLAGVLLKKNELAEAETLDREALAIHRQVLGENHREVAKSLNKLALVLRRARKWIAAEPVSREALELTRKFLPPDSSELSDALADTIVVLLRVSKFEEAETLARECLAIREKLRPNSSRAFVARSMVGTSLLAQKRYADAEPLLVQAYEGLFRRENDQPDASRSNLVSEAGERIVQLYQAWDKPDQAAEWRKRLNQRPPNPQP